MIRRIVSVCLLLGCFLFITCTPGGGRIKVKGPLDRTAEMEADFFSCPKLIDYEGQKINVEGIDIPLKIYGASIPIKVGKVDINPQLIRSLSQTAMILDNYQYRTCQRALIIKDNDRRDQYIADQAKIEGEIIELSIVIQSSSTSTAKEFESKVKKWMDDIVESDRLNQ